MRPQCAHLQGELKGVGLWGVTLLISRVGWEGEGFVMFVVIKDVLKFSPFVNHAMNEADLVGHFKQHELIMNCFKQSTSLYPTLSHAFAQRTRGSSAHTIWWQIVGNKSWLHVILENHLLMSCLSLAPSWLCSSIRIMVDIVEATHPKSYRTVPVSVLRVPWTLISFEKPYLPETGIKVVEELQDPVETELNTTLFWSWLILSKSFSFCDYLTSDGGNHR